MDTIIATIQSRINLLTSDNINRANVISNEQATIDANTSEIASLEANLATLQAPTVQQAINDLIPPADN